jgi:hypothetical protein
MKKLRKMNYQELCDVLEEDKHMNQLFKAIELIKDKERTKNGRIQKQIQKRSIITAYI